MNLVGKILVFLILVTSVVFMSFAVAVYATHKNWKDAVERPQAEVGPGKPLGLKYQLADMQKLKDQKAQELEAYKKAQDEADVKKRQDLAKLESYKNALDKEHAELKDQFNKLAERDKEAIATLDTAQQNLAKLTAEVMNLREEIRNTQKDRDKQFDTVVKLTDEIQQTQGEIKRVAERRDQLTAQVARQGEVIKRNGLTEYDLDKNPPKMRGKILAINKEKKVEISLGSDDGLRPGHTLEVFRGANYLGRVEVLSADVNRAVAKILPDFSKGAIQKGDDVATRFKNEVAARFKND